MPTVNARSMVESLLGTPGVNPGTIVDIVKSFSVSLTTVEVAKLFELYYREFNNHQFVRMGASSARHWYEVINNSMMNQAFKDSYHRSVENWVNTSAEIMSPPH